MNRDEVQPGLRVSIGVLGDSNGMAISQEHLRWRRQGAIGIVLRHVVGHGGDVWWVRQDDGQVAAYSFDEMEKPQ